MKKQILILTISMIFLLAIMPNFISAEMTYWTQINIDNSEQTVTQHGYYQFDDTSAKGIGRNKPIEIILWYDVEGLPYDLSVDNYSGYVDWCNLTISHLKNEYGKEFIAWHGFVGGEYINTTTTTDSYFFQNTTNPTNGQLYYDLKDKDSLTIDMKCHYTDSSSVFAESILFGRFTTYFGAYECDDCEEYSLEELSNAVDKNEEVIAHQTEVYDKIQSVVNMNYQLWLIASWLVKVSFLIIAITTIFAGIYYLYLFFKDIEGQIK